MKRYLLFAALVTVAACGETAPVQQSGGPEAPRTVNFTKTNQLARGTTAVLIPTGADPLLTEVAAREACAGEQFCKVLGYFDASALPTALPMTDRELAAQVYSYSLNRQSGLDESLWSCTAFTGIAPGRCLAAP